jgi:peroxiredoxin
MGLAEDPTPQTPPVLLQMIRDDAVHRDLGLSEPQRQQVMRVLKEVDGPWFRSRILPAETQARKVDELSKLVESQLPQILEPDQQKRIRELVRQAMGTRMVLRDDVVEALELSSSEVDAFREIFGKTDTGAQAIQAKLRAGELDPNAAQREVEQLKQSEREQMTSLLDKNQQAKIGGLTGTPFDFSQVKRTYPLAPAFTQQGVTWIQGGPLTWDQLNGKVVAVHFYAFQCINCQRNLPHYQAWHEDYADRGLVVIGIQTPETSSERQIDRVTAAAKLADMEYPLIMDAESSNWKAWGNTMWPTVYLVDKRGFVRRWWQGELNWKGTPGEQQMRQTIEQLLAEQP